MELSVFGGQELEGWLRKCSKYFEVYEVTINRKVDLASLYLIEQAEYWFSGWKKANETGTWEEFSTALTAQFREVVVEDVVIAFKELWQLGTMVEYQGEFEKTKYQMEWLNPLFLKAYFVSNFIGRLKNEIAMAVRMFKPATVLEAVEQARLQELVLQAQQTGSDQPKVLSLQPNVVYKARPKTYPAHQPILSPKPISSYNPKNNPNPQHSAVVQPKPVVTSLPPTSQNAPAV